MNKLSLTAVSLVAAIPGGALAVLMALVFLRHAEHMKTSMLVLAGLTLAVSALVTVMPLGILIFGSKAKPNLKADKAKPDDEDDSEDDQEQDSPDESGELELSDSEAELALAEGDENLEMADDDDFGFSDDDFDMDDEEDTDEKG